MADGRVALVTGAGRGIGRATALALARAGAHVAVNYHTSIDGAEAAVREITGLGRRAIAVRADVADSARVTSMVEAVLRQMGRIDILVNSAGTASRIATTDLTEAEWDRVVDVNLKGAFLCVRAVLPTMMAQRWGRIINISSIAGQTGGRLGAHYAAAKAGLLGLTKFLARELGPWGITVNAVAPSGIPTDLLSQTGVDPAALAERPVGRAGTPEEVAAAVVFLAFDAAAYITGQTISLNGGLWMG
ncbi:MAG: 3-oxoacyl-ACP reductase family protein [Armatimonadota bacterium]|nr:3-oxoacyl-ACP reductase family protein [Armatimonadota bacterium]MDR7426347.1 3-oxoacyl-ACP reductase family protein [Armatimonadota bacterium]MDR7469169.1 3-oxoacyl-ACP reductase family protein [Armatimonadota bacterium]MDR7474560.1 3-oxoacyl-ACP reductase family protein [Armatimonadota bacterium]MDR7538704.1 3-oxoacyl-ACP reductase family protein [Armatimonadota bacterium]